MIRPKEDKIKEGSQLSEEESEDSMEDTKVVDEGVPKMNGHHNQKDESVQSPTKVVEKEPLKLAELDVDDWTRLKG